MTYDLLDLINLKNRLYKEFNQTLLNMWNIIQEKLTYRQFQRIYKRNKHNVKMIIIIIYFIDTNLT